MLTIVVSRELSVIFSEMRIAKLVFPPRLRAL